MVFGGDCLVIRLAGRLAFVLDAMLGRFLTMTVATATGWLVALNVVVFALSLLAGAILVRLFHDRPVADGPDPVSWQEWALATSCVALNSGVTVAGWWLWRRGLIVVRPGGLGRSAADVAVLFVAMDFLMYVFHRAAHVGWLFPWVHATHHRYDRPRPLNLYVLNPAEVLGFGGLWLGVLCTHPSTAAGIGVYLAINLSFGTLGHLGVEPFPRSVGRWPVLRHLGSSTFHAHHHGDRDVNFGFYTDVWDRLFRTRRGTG